MIISSAFTEQSQICVMNRSCQARTGRLVLAGESDPLFVPTSSLMQTLTPSTDDPAKEEQSKETKNELKGFHNKIV